MTVSLPWNGAPFISPPGVSTIKSLCICVLLDVTHMYEICLLHITYPLGEQCAAVTVALWNHLVGYDYRVCV